METRPKIRKKGERSKFGMLDTIIKRDKPPLDEVAKIRGCREAEPQ